MTQLVSLELDCRHEPRLHPPALQMPPLPLLRRLRCWLPSKDGPPGLVPLLQPPAGAGGAQPALQVHDAFVCGIVDTCPALQQLELLGYWDTHATEAHPSALRRLAQLRDLRALSIARNCFAMSLDEL